MIVRVAVELDVPARAAWGLLKRRDTFRFITRGAMCCRGAESWPAVLMAPGVAIETVVRPLGLPPGLPHASRIVRFDDGAMEVETNEAGGLIRTWDHSMRVEPVAEGRCRYVDRVDLDAGWLTPVGWLVATAFSRYRQARWRRLVRTPAADL